MLLASTVARVAEAADVAGVAEAAEVGSYLNNIMHLNIITLNGSPSQISRLNPMYPPPNPEPLKARIHGLSQSLPSAPEDRHRLLHRYAQHRGYEFLSEHSKLHRYFSLKLSGAGELRASEMAIENETAIRMEGSLEEISVGGMCEIVKENLGKVLLSYYLGSGAVSADLATGLSTRVYLWSR